MPRPSHDLEQYRETIMGCYEGGASLQQIHTYLTQEFSISTSDRTIQRRIRDWRAEEEAPGQKTRTIDSEALRERIKELFNTPGGMKDKEMLDVLRSEGYTVGSAWLAKKRVEMGMCRRGKGDWEVWAEQEKNKAEQGGSRQLGKSEEVEGRV